MQYNCHCVFTFFFVSTFSFFFSEKYGSRCRNCWSGISTLIFRFAASCKFSSEKYPVSPCTSAFFNGSFFPVTSFMVSSRLSSIWGKHPLSAPEPIAWVQTMTWLPESAIVIPYIPLNISVRAFY